MADAISIFAEDSAAGIPARRRAYQQPSTRRWVQLVQEEFTAAETRSQAAPLLESEIEMRLRALPVFRPTVDALCRYRTLETDWDGYGAREIAHDAVDASMNLLYTLRKTYPYLDTSLRPFDVAPVADGSVQLEWRGDSQRIEVEIHPDRRLSYLLIDQRSGKPVYHEVNGVDRPAVVNMIVRVVTDS